MRYCFILVVVLGITHPAFAEDSVPIPPLSLELDSAQDRIPPGLHATFENTVASRYWGSIVGGIFYQGGPVCFSNFTLTQTDALGSTYLLAGMITPLDTLKWDNQEQSGGNEYYIGIGRTFDFGKEKPSDLALVRLNIFVMYDAISPIKELGNDLFQEFIRLDFPRVPFFQPYVEGYHWDKVGHQSPQIGTFGRAGIHRQQPLGFSLFDFPMELGIDLSVGYAITDIFGTSEGLAYYRAVLSTEIKVSEHLSIIPAVIGQWPGSQADGEAFVNHREIFFNITLRWQLF